jgi:glutathione S-transferase
MFSSFANASLMPILTLRMFLDVLTSQTPWLLRPLPKAIRYGAVSAFVKPEMEKMFKYLDEELEGREFFLGGKLSRADVMMSWPMDFCVQRGYLDLEGEDGKRYPRVKAWRERVLGREGWKEAMRKVGGAGEYDLRTFG